MKKPNYRFGINRNNKLIINPDTRKPYLFEYVRQAENFIYRKYGESRNFQIIDIQKKRKKK